MWQIKAWHNLSAWLHRGPGERDDKCSRVWGKAAARTHKLTLTHSDHPAPEELHRGEWQVQFICVPLAGEYVPRCSFSSNIGECAAQRDVCAAGGLRGKLDVLICWCYGFPQPEPSRPAEESCASLVEDVSRVAGRGKDGEAVKQRQGADTRQLGQPGQEQSSPWRHHVFQVMFYVSSPNQVNGTIRYSQASIQNLYHGHK